MRKLIYMDGFDSVQDENGKEVFSTAELHCNTPDHTDSVVGTVVRMYNERATFEELDHYLLWEGRCSQEDREEILEGIYCTVGFNPSVD